MNPQPDFFEVLPFIAIFIGMIIYFSAHPKKVIRLSDKFTIAEIEGPDTLPEQGYISVDVNTKTKKKKTRKKKKAQAQGYNQLQQDCLDALKSIGVKTARERKFIVNSTFNKHNPKSVQEFLSLAMMRGN